MDEATIDPYTQFLGLPPGPRPPSYYELLGLEMFCSHHERINQAVRKQFRIIKPFQDHPERRSRETIQDIMNEIATARVVLVDPERKEDYDLALASDRKIDRDARLAEQVAVPLPEFALTVIAGPSLVGRTVELVEGTTVTIGSDLGCSLPVDVGRAGPRHCTIDFVDGGWLLRRCDPDCIVRVNDNTCEEYALAAAQADGSGGDRIDVGGYRLLFTRIADTPTGGIKWTGPAVPPLSMIVIKGPSILAAVLNALPPQRIVVGHAETALWRLPERLISGHHFAVQTVGDGWELEDLDSKNGTAVNGKRVLRHIFADRDVITVGPFCILVSLRA